VDQTTGQAYALQPQPQALAVLAGGDRFLNSAQGYVIAYYDKPYQQTEVHEPVPVTYSLYHVSSPQRLAQVTGNNVAEPTVSPNGQLFVVPGKLVTLLWPAEERQGQIACGSQAVFSPDGQHLALCGSGVDILDTSQGQRQAGWSCPMFAPSPMKSLIQVHLSWGECLCEFHELCTQKWEHSFRSCDNGCRIRDTHGRLLATVESKEGVNWAVATGPQSLFRALANHIEWVDRGQIKRRWRSHWPFGLSPSMVEVPGSGYALATDTGGLWVVGKEGQTRFACEPFFGGSLYSLDAHGKWIAAMDFEKRLLLWSAQDGRRLGWARATGPGEKVKLTENLVYACGALWRLP